MEATWGAGVRGLGDTGKTSSSSGKGVGQGDGVADKQVYMQVWVWGCWAQSMGLPRTQGALSQPKRPLLSRLHEPTANKILPTPAMPPLPES